MPDGLSAVQHGGGWITNVGNAFLDLGSLWAIRDAVDRDVQTTLSSSFPRWTTSKLKRGPLSLFGSDAPTQNVFDTCSNYDVDYLVRSGACLSDRWFRRHGDVLEAAVDNGTRVVFHGVGFGEDSYDAREIEKVREWLEALEPYALVSRDERTYEALCGIAEHTYSGIDCAFFLNDLHDPVPMTDEYVALNFDKQLEADEALAAVGAADAVGAGEATTSAQVPERADANGAPETGSAPETVETAAATGTPRQPAALDSTGTPATTDATGTAAATERSDPQLSTDGKGTTAASDAADDTDGTRVVRPHHSFWYPWDLRAYPKMIEQYYEKENVFVSDVPEEYLDLYASVSETHADRVHACVATLVFGSPARLYLDTPRSSLLDRVGHGSVTERLTEPDLETIEREKEEQLRFLRSILQ